MTAPEKIYLQVCGDCPQTDCDNCKFDDLEDNVTWAKERIFKKDVEYTRTDAFIEKACEWLKDNIYHRVYECGDRLGFPTANFIGDFKKYMEGDKV